MQNKKDLFFIVSSPSFPDTLDVNYSDWGKKNNQPFPGSGSGMMAGCRQWSYTGVGLGRKT
jgi:hypothetical protein